MKDNEFSELSERFLLMQKENIFISDKDTYEVLFADESLKKIFGADIVGKKCFSAFAGKNEPCRSCISADCDETVQSWEIHRMYGDKKYMYLVRGMISGSYKICKLMDISEYIMLVDDVVRYTSDLYHEAEMQGSQDGLTGLDNRNKYISRCDDEYTGEDTFGVIYFDVNNMKTTNDTYGHETGDELLICVASAIKQLSGENRHAYRMGGDEFVLVIPNATEDEMNSLVSRWKTLSENLVLNNGVRCDTAFGFALGTRRESLENVMTRADTNMYINKHGKGRR